MVLELVKCEISLCKEEFVLLVARKAISAPWTEASVLLSAFILLFFIIFI